MATDKSALDRLDEQLDKLEAGLKIDKYKLDDEHIDHPTYLNNIGQNHMSAISYRDEAKADLEGIKAKLDQQLRAQHAEAGEKFTEAGLNSEIIVHPEYQKAQNLLGAWNDRVGQWRVLWDSACARTDMLKSMGYLYNSSYWAEMAGAPERREARTRKVEEIKDDIMTKRAAKADGEDPPRRTGRVKL